MNYFKPIQQNEELKEALWEIPASFFFVLMYFMLIEHAAKAVHTLELVIAPILFFIVYYVLYRIFEKKAVIHLIPIVSFIESLEKENFNIFLYRLPGQVTGAFVATLVHFAGVKIGLDTDFSIMIVPAHPFLTAIFTGFAAQFIYFLYHFVIYKVHAGSNARYLMFSLGLGFFFFVLLYYNNIIILNPFGIALHYLFAGNTIDAGIIITGLITQAIVPIVFIAGTHYYLDWILKIRRK